MDLQKRFKYHQVAKQLGVPNIILTGIEKKAKMKYPDDDEMYVCHVIKTLKAMADEHAGDWSKCEMADSATRPGARGYLRK